jgi:hypothetical protein
MESDLTNDDLHKEMLMAWTPVHGFPGYSVNTLGQVQRDRSGRIQSPAVNQFGTVYVGMYRDFHKFHRSLAKLVADTFLDPPRDTAFDTPINLDGDRYNCSIANLMWRPRWFAIQYHHQFKERYVRPIEEELRARETQEVFPGSWEAACRYGLLERDVVLSVENHAPVWPSYIHFYLA